MVEAEAPLKVRPYSFHTTTEQSIGFLRLGTRVLEVNVDGFSWAGFTLNVPPKVAKKIRIGTTGRFTHAGATHDVSCAAHEKLEDGSVQVELHRELSADERKRLKRQKVVAHCAATHTLTQRDPVLSFATIVFIVMILMILPGWGEAWGTSDFFTSGVRTLFGVFFR